MNKLLSLGCALSVALFTVSTGCAQSVPEPSPATPPTWGKVVDDTFTALRSAQDNIYYTAYYVHAPALQLKNGAGVGVFWKVNELGSTNLSVQTMAGTRIDYVNGGFWMPSGNVSFEVPIKVLSWTGVSWLQDVAFVPLVYGGLGIPLSGARVGNFKVPGTIRNNNGDATAIVGYGGALRLLNSSRVTLYAAYDNEKWSGFDGTQDRFALVLKVGRKQ